MPSVKITRLAELMSKEFREEYDKDKTNSDLAKVKKYMKYWFQGMKLTGHLEHGNYYVILPNFVCMVCTKNIGKNNF